MKSKIKVICMAFVLGVLFLSVPKVQAETTYPYLIKVNRQQSVVTVYEKDKKGAYTVPVKAMLCSPGWDTPLGSFRTPEKYRWKLLMDDVWGQYSTRINKGVLFHSVWYYEKDPSTLANVQFNKLGTICSHGCVRLSVEDAKWIYDNCPVGTTVTIYDSKNPGPLGKPTGIKVSTATKMGYDPTDVWSPGNPYIKSKPQIKGVKDKTIEYGESVNLLSGVSAVSSTNVPISNPIETKIKYQGKKVSKVNTSTVGKYYVTYQVTDNLKKKATAEAIITVVDNTKPSIKGAYNIYLNGEETPDEDTLLEGVSAVWHEKQLAEGSIKASLKRVKLTDDLKIYDIIYKATAPNGKTVQKIKKLYIDLQAPVLTGVADREIDVDTVVDRTFAMENITVSDNYSSLTESSVKVSISKESDTQYTVTYTVKDKCRNVTRQTATYTITNFLSFEGVKDRTIAATTYVGTYEALRDIKAYNGTTDITGSIKVQISELVDGKYTVTYTIKDEAGHEKTAVAVFTVE